ncbi:MAG: hypothetical protein H7Z74_01515 [Anaerolineae bacterium]|nr:hypothetical protein [Gemmatimonadaceae bacterium]
MSNRSWLVVPPFLCAALFACGDDRRDIIAPGVPSGGELFRSYVALGDGWAAGFQSLGINDSTQREAYPQLLARQFGTRYAFASLALPGCPPPVVNFQTQARVGGGTATTCALRSPSSFTERLNNVAVPGAASIDATSTGSANSNTLTTFILGGKTQLQKALDTRPTFVTVGFVNGDFVAAAASGVLTPTPGVSPGVTTPAAFASNIAAVVDPLLSFRAPGFVTAGSVQGGVLLGAVNVLATPLFFPAAALVNAQFKGGLDAATGKTIAVLPNCTGSASLISTLIIPAIRDGTHPAVIACSAGSIPGTPVGDVFVLEAAEQASISLAVALYNGYLSAKADSTGLVFVDPNPVIALARLSGLVRPVINVGSATEPFGAFFSLDPLHPSGLGQKLIANEMIRKINGRYGTAVPQIP